MKKVLKHFDIEKAKAGAKVVTRNGKNVRIAFYDVHRSEGDMIIALVNNDMGYEEPGTYYKNGQYCSTNESEYDLIIEEVEFEDGDILANRIGENLAVLIFEKIENSIINFNFKYYAMLFYSGCIEFNGHTFDNGFVLATEEEKKKLFDALAAIGKRWNAEKKAIEDIKEENKYEFKRGQAVLVKDDDNAIWYPAIFIDYNSYCDYVYPFITTKGTYKMCIDYDSNRELAYKQNNPE